MKKWTFTGLNKCNKWKLLQGFLFFIVLAIILRLPWLPVLGWHFTPGNYLEYVYLLLFFGFFFYYSLKVRPEWFGFIPIPENGDENYEEFMIEYNNHFFESKMPFIKYCQERHGDHDHCTFCGITISSHNYEGSIKNAYFKDDSCEWVCQKCFEQFKNKMNWKDINNEE